MDCDKFERVLVSHLYGELDELTRAGASRHCDQCRRCQLLWSRLRVTREVGALPLRDPPENFEQRVLDAERQVHERLPLRLRLSRNLTILAGYAMRPQLAMAALALLMLGSSLLLLRPHPRSPSAMREPHVEGVPRQEPEEFVVPVPETDEEDMAADTEVAPALEPAASAVATARGRAEAALTTPASQQNEMELDLARARAEDRAYAAAMAALRAANHAAAQQQFDAIVAAQGRNAAAAELYAALAAEQAQGCSAALPRFDSVAAKYSSADLGNMATWHSAICRTQLGHDRRALLDFQKLLKVPAYAERAKKYLGLVGTEAAAEVNNEVPVAASVAAVLGTSPPAAGESAALEAPTVGDDPATSSAAAPTPAGNSTAAAPTSTTPIVAPSANTPSDARPTPAAPVPAPVSAPSSR
jgi:hypothetical protein